METIPLNKKKEETEPFPLSLIIILCSCHDISSRYTAMQFPDTREDEEAITPGNCQLHQFNSASFSRQSLLSFVENYSSASVNIQIQISRFILQYNVTNTDTAIQTRVWNENM